MGKKFDYNYNAKKDGFSEAEIYSMIKDIILQLEKRIIDNVTFELDFMHMIMITSECSYDFFCGEMK